MNPPVFLIGCEGNHYFPRAMQQLKSGGFPAPILIEGVNGRAPGAEELLSFPFLLNQYNIGRDGKMGPRITDLACCDAHLRIYQNIIANDFPYAFVFEDDVTILEKNAFKEMKSIVQCLIREVPGWGFISFAEMGDFCSVMPKSKPDGMYETPRVYSTQKPSYGTVAYAISNLGARVIYEYGIPMRYPIDNIIVEPDHQFIKLQSKKSYAHHNFGPSRIS